MPAYHRHMLYMVEFSPDVCLGLCRGPVPPEGTLTRCLKGSVLMPDLESFFHPRSVAVVGAPSDAAVSQGAGVFVPALIAAGFKGDIYPVNPKANAIMGLRTYPDLMSVPQTPDFVICCLAAPRTPQLMRDCIGKGVKAVCIYSAGFSEASENGRKLEQELVMLARRGGIRMMGPNCMGIYCPSAGLSYNPRASREPGSVGLVCQSGGNSLRLTMLGESLGLRFSKVVSYGNAADVSEADFLEYLADDTETEVIGAYIEGVREGQRFVSALAYAADRKPVIVLKGGRTQAGSQAAASHTGAVASSKATWDALCQQARAVQAYSLEDMLDFIETCLYMRVPGGRRVGIMGWGGGTGVISADDCETAGLSVPRFSSELRLQLSRLIPEAGSSVSNPVDSAAVVSPSMISEIVGTIARSREIDLLLAHMPLASALSPLDAEVREAMVEAIVDAGASTDLPVALAQAYGGTADSAGMFAKVKQRCVEKRVPVYATTGRAAQAVARFIDYRAQQST